MARDSDGLISRPINHRGSEKLDLSLNPLVGASVAPSAIPQACQRLTSQPLQALFELTAAHWAAEDEGERWRGLRLQAVDGTHFSTSAPPN